jgi:hypothetical protein
MDQILAIAVVLLPTVFAVVLEIVNEEIKKSVYWRVGVMAFGLSLSTLTAYQMVRATKAAYIDREGAIVETSEKVSKSVSASVSEQVSKSVSKSVSDQYAQTINQLQLQIGSLQGQIAAQGKSVEAIKGSNIISGKKPVAVVVTNLTPSGSAPPEIHVTRLSSGTNPNPEYGKNATKFILTTNIVMNGGRVLVTCTKGIIKQGGAELPGAGAMMSGGGGVMDEHTFKTDIGSPNWSPDFPLVVTLYSDSDDLGVCTFKPLS